MDCGPVGGAKLDAYELSVGVYTAGSPCDQLCPCDFHSPEALRSCIKNDCGLWLVSFLFILWIFIFSNFPFSSRAMHAKPLKIKLTSLSILVSLSDSESPRSEPGLD